MRKEFRDVFFVSIGEKEDAQKTFSGKVIRMTAIITSAIEFASV